MDLNPIILSIPIYFFLILLELIWSGLKKKKTYRLGDAITNIGCGIFEQITGLFAKVFTVGLFFIIYENYRFFTIPVNIFTIFILWLGIDFLYYWAHRLSHEVNLFWSGHVVHHQSEDYNLSVALRQGALQKFFTSPFYIPLALLGFSPEWFLYLSALNTLYQFWIHTEYIGKMGYFELIFNTPSHHRVHHGRDPKYIDKNHAGSLIIWDKMFGTFQAEIERPNYGITRPTYTFNPIKAHIKALIDLYEDVNRARGLNKIKVLFKEPGWNPISKNEKSKKHIEYSKFDFHPNKRSQLYVLVQFIILLGLTSFLLFNFNNFSGMVQLSGVVFIVISLWSIGNIYEGEKKPYTLELLRFALLLIVYNYVPDSNRIGSFLIVIIAAISTFFIFTNTHKNNKTIEVQ